MKRVMIDNHDDQVGGLIWEGSVWKGVLAAHANWAFKLTPLLVWVMIEDLFTKNWRFTTANANALNLSPKSWQGHFRPRELPGCGSAFRHPTTSPTFPSHPPTLQFHPLESNYVWNWGLAQCWTFWKPYSWKADKSSKNNLVRLYFHSIQGLFHSVYFYKSVVSEISL